MKKTKTGDTPAIRIIDGIPFVRVVDLAHLWNTTTAAILATDKPHHVPEEHLRCIDTRLWCSFAGLRYRIQATQQNNHLTRLIREFLESHAEKQPAAAPSEPVTSEPGTAALAAAYDARDVAYDAKTDAENNAKSLDAFDDRIAAVENDSYRRFNTAMRRIHNVERRQGDAAVNMTQVEQRQHWTLQAFAVMAAVQVLAAIVRLARR